MRKMWTKQRSSRPSKAMPRGATQRPTLTSVATPTASKVRAFLYFVDGSWTSCLVKRPYLMVEFWLVIMRSFVRPILRYLPNWTLLVNKSALRRAYFYSFNLIAILLQDSYRKLGGVAKFRIVNLIFIRPYFTCRLGFFVVLFVSLLVKNFNFCLFCSWRFCRWWTVNELRGGGGSRPRAPARPPARRRLLSRSARPLCVAQWGVRHWHPR